MSSADSLGRSTSNAESVWIFDLDETILSVNSFRYWVRFMLGDKSPTHLRGFAAVIMAAKKLHLLSHGAAKNKLQYHWQDAFPDGNTTFNMTLSETIRPNMVELLKHVAAGLQPALLATAAAEIYAEPFGRTLGFKHIIATKAGAALENRAERKRDSACAFLEEKNWQGKKRIFFTDHAEDLPLMQASAVTCWFGAAEKMPQGEGLKVIPCLELDAQALLELVSAL